MRKKSNIFILFLWLTAVSPLRAQTNEKDIAAAADKNFKSGNYAEALPLFAQLLATNAAETKYSYYYGVCRYMRGVNVGDAIAHLEKAATNKATPADVNYYLARCYHLTYHFTEAITFYEKFKKTAQAQQLQSLEVDLNIAMCRNAINLPDKSDRYLINDKKIVDENHFLTLYQLDPLRDGKILVMTDDYKSGADKKRGEKQYLYLDAGANRLYYSSRGVDGEQSSDVMLSLKKINKWDKATKLKEANSKYDEINPTAAKDGKVIYFSAKSPESMGGFDIFKMEYNAETGSYGKPENVGAPINSPADDFLYATSNIERTNYITSTRDCEKGKVCVIKFDENEPTDGYILIKGRFFNFDRPNEFNVNIIFFDQQNWKNLGEARVDSKTGEYSIKVPGAARYGCKIDVVGYSLLLGDFILRRDKKTVNQEIIINKQNNGQERLAIKNSYQEDAMLLFAQAKAKEKSLVNAPAQQTALATKKEIKREDIKRINALMVKTLAQPTAELAIRKTVDWKTERLAIAAALKPEEDKEILAWSKEDANNKTAVAAKQQTTKKQDEPAFNLENVSFADLESQSKKAKPKTDNLKSDTQPDNNLERNNLKRNDLNITAAKTNQVKELNVSSAELALNKTTKRTGKANYISDLPPIGYEILDENDKARKEIVVAPIAENKIEMPTEPTKRTDLKITKAETVKQKQLAVPTNDLALKVNKNQTGNVNYIAALPEDKEKEKIKTENISLAVAKSAKQLDAVAPSLSLSAVEKTGKVNYVSSLPEEKIMEANKVSDVTLAETKKQKQLELMQPQISLAVVDKTGKANYIASLPEAVEKTEVIKVKDVTFAEAKPVKPLESKQPSLTLAQFAKTGKANYIASLPALKPEVEQNAVAANNTPEIKKPASVNLISTKTISAIDNNQKEVAAIDVKDKTGKVNYIKSLPEPEVARIQNAIATIDRKEISALYNTVKKQTLAPMTKAGKVKVKLPLEKVEEKEQLAATAPSKVNAIEKSTTPVTSIKENRVEIAVVVLAPAAPRETDVASLRYRFRAFENKSDSQVREIIGRATTGGLGQ